MGITLLMGFIGTVIGGLITWYVTKKYYIRASDDLRQESSNLGVLVNILINYLKVNNLINIKRDKQGNVLGYIIPTEKNGRIVLHTYGDPRKGNIEFDNVVLGKKTIKKLGVFPQKDDKTNKKKH